MDDDDGHVVDPRVARTRPWLYADDVHVLSTLAYPHRINREPGYFISTILACGGPRCLRWILAHEPPNNEQLEALFSIAVVNSCTAEEPLERTRLFTLARIFLDHYGVELDRFQSPFYALARVVAAYDQRRGIDWHAVCVIRYLIDHGATHGGEHAGWIEDHKRRRRTALDRKWESMPVLIHCLRRGGMLKVLIPYIVQPLCASAWQEWE